MGISEQFNLVAKEYDENRRRFIPCFDDFYRDSTAFIADSIDAPQTVLDLGAGTGLLSAIWYEWYPKASYVLVDIASEMLAVAERRFHDCANVRMIRQDYASGLPAGNFDVVMSALSVHHLEDDAKQMLFERVYDRLPAGGVFVNYDQFCASTLYFTRMYDKYWIRQLEESGLSDEDIVLWRGRRELDRECSVESEVIMLRKAGFQKVDCIFDCRKFAVIMAVK